MCVSPRSFAKTSTSDMSWSRGIPCNGLDNLISALLRGSKVGGQRRERDDCDSHNSSRLRIKPWITVFVGVLPHILFNLWCARHRRDGHAHEWTEAGVESSNKRPYEPNERGLNTTGECPYRIRRGHAVMPLSSQSATPGAVQDARWSPTFFFYSVSRTRGLFNNCHMSKTHRSISDCTGHSIVSLRIFPRLQSYRKMVPTLSLQWAHLMEIDPWRPIRIIYLFSRQVSPMVSVSSVKSPPPPPRGNKSGELTGIMEPSDSDQIAVGGVSHD
jgi:hypothetical protein